MFLIRSIFEFMLAIIAIFGIFGLGTIFISIMIRYINKPKLLLIDIWNVIDITSSIFVFWVAYCFYYISDIKTEKILEILNMNDEEGSEK